MYALNEIHHVDLLTLCDQLDDQSVDCIISDLLYGTTACHWGEFAKVNFNVEA